MSTTATTLTSRERFSRTLEHKEVDRVPRHESFWPDTIARWEGEGLQGGQEGILRELGSDLCSVRWVWPAPFAGQEVVVAEDEQTSTQIDAFGAKVRWWKRRNGTPEHLGFTCDSPEVWRAKFRPALERATRHFDLDAAREALAAGRAAEKFLVISGVEGWEMLRKLLGDEGMAVAMGEEPEWVHEVAEVATDVILANYQALWDGGVRPDAIFTYGDMAYTQSMFCSPQMYRELIWPSHCRMARWAHERGMKFIYHTDGDVRRVMDLYLEAGFDALQPLEAKAAMDVRDLAPRYGSRISLFGNIDARVLSTNDPERIEAEIAGKLAAGKASRGYIAHSDHSVPPDVTLETYRHVIRLIDKHGWY